MNVNPNRCRYCQNFFCCEGHKIDHEVKHHKKPNLPLWMKNRNVDKQTLPSKNYKQPYHNQVREYGIIEEKESKAKHLSRKRPYSFIKANENKINSTALLKSVTFPERKILKPKYKNIKICCSKNNFKVPKTEMNYIKQTDNAITTNNKAAGLSCVFINKRPGAVDKKLDSPDSSEQNMINTINRDNPLTNSVTNETNEVPLEACTSDKSQQAIAQTALTQSLLETKLLVQGVLHTEIHYEVTNQNRHNGHTESPPIDIRKEVSMVIVSPVSDGGTPPGQTSTPVTSDQEDVPLKTNDNWCSAMQNLSLSIYKTSVEQYTETFVGSLISPKETESNHVKHNPAATPLRGIMKNSKYDSPGNETFNSTSSLTKLRRVTFSDTPDNHLTKSDLSDAPAAAQSNVSGSLQLHGNSMFKTVADFVTSALQSLPGILSSSFDRRSDSEIKFKVPKPSKRIRSPDSETSSGYSPSHKRRCYHCYLKENPIRRRRSISDGASAVVYTTEGDYNSTVHSE